MSTDTTEDIVRLTTAPNPPMAHILQQSLADAGIRSQVVGDYLDAGLGDIPGLQPEIWVRREDLERAQEVLRATQEPASDFFADRSEEEERSAGEARE
jgi:hypothetical protein